MKMYTWTKDGKSLHFRIKPVQLEQNALADNGYEYIGYVNVEPDTSTMTDDQLLAELQAPDMVKHPPHYTFGEYEVKDVIEDWGFGTGFFLGNAIKYIARAQHKGRYVEDLRKAQEYLGFEIEAEKKREEKKEEERRAEKVKE